MKIQIAITIPDNQSVITLGEVQQGFDKLKRELKTVHPSIEVDLIITP